MSDSSSVADADRIAATVFGIRLRAPQRRALTPLMAGSDTLAVLPTGSGKSAIYQVAGLVLGGLTVVISPLIALQRDQMRNLAECRRPSNSYRAPLWSLPQPLQWPISWRMTTSGSNPSCLSSSSVTLKV